MLEGLFVASFLVIVAAITAALAIYEKRQKLEFIGDSFSPYPPEWFAPVNEPNKPDWEILPQEAKPNEVILSKRNELGILSNFAATPFELYGKRYTSVEGFWQMMLYPEGPDDPRAKTKGVEWKYTRSEVAQMTAFDAKGAGTLAEENMAKWVSTGARLKVNVSLIVQRRPANTTASSSKRCVPSSNKTLK